MSPRKRILLLLAVVALVATGCGANEGKSQSTTTTTDAHKSSTATSDVALRGAVRAAISANVRLSTYVLWHNKIPVWATQSTRGPALRALRNSAAARRRQGIQIKNLSGRYTITAIALAPSYATATAVIKSHQRVAPYKAGHRLGRAIVANVQAHVELHRLNNRMRFIVWSVSTS